MAETDRDWDQRYRDGQTPWNSGLPSAELERTLDEQKIRPGRALELGCGAGTNAIWLARRGFDVTAVDCAPTALAAARQAMAAAGVRVHWIEADVQGFQPEAPPADFVFDRGCYHCCRKVNLAGFLATLRHVTRPGTLYLCLAGNADEQSEYGPPRLTAAELCRELEPLFQVRVLRSFHFEDAGRQTGPLGWSALLERRGG